MNFDAAWRYRPPADGKFVTTRIPDDVLQEFLSIAARVSNQHEDPKRILEHFKQNFGDALGKEVTNSSSPSWARTDLESLMEDARDKPLLFLDAYCESIRTLRKRFRSLTLPPDDVLNDVLAAHDVGYLILEENILARGSSTPVPVPESPIWAKAQGELWKTLSESERRLEGGDSMGAVREIWWVLESISTFFEGKVLDGSRVKGEYFNTIIRDLRKSSSGTFRQAAMRGVESIHGYLSDPKGGAIRHGIAPNARPLTPSEARLLCNIARSYATYFIEEFELLSTKG